MPTYAYKCCECDHIFEATHSYKERLSDCPTCGAKNSLKKHFGTPIQVITRSKTTKSKAGSIVNREIKRIKEDIKEYDKKRRKENNKK